ncbi:Glutamate N-acetyltransferase / Amino-acid acetyltransferase [Candidatus Magnetomoraceae bacterium gMMP-15]
MKKDFSNISCPGFTFAGIASGLKKDYQKDLGLIVSQVPACTAGVFTRNKVQAAPVLLDKKRIKSGKCQAIIINSGNANCCNGKSGMEDAMAMARMAGDALNISEDSVLAASTGVIGKPLEILKIEEAIPDLIGALSPNGITDLAQSIMTTDTVPKAVFRQTELNGGKFTIAAVAKGAGMIRPDMATMLCFVCTDVKASQKNLQKALSSSVDSSFNIITVDGDTSTNDTILLMANGLSRLSLDDPLIKTAFQNILDDLLLRLAKEIVRDGEGATKLAKITVKGADSRINAKMVVETVANSNLLKTALFGEDANWGRILAAAGRSGYNIDPDKIDIFFNAVQVVKNGMGCGNKAEKEAGKVLKEPEFNIFIDLKMGTYEANVYTCDFSVDYVKINANYRT